MGLKPRRTGGLTSFKHRFLNLTILYTAVTSLLTYTNVEVGLRHDHSRGTPHSGSRRRT